MELSNVEKLAVAQAFLKSVGEMVETGNPDNLRGKVDAEMKRLYETSTLAGSSFDVKLLGKKVGTYSLTISKPKESKERKELAVDDETCFTDWALEHGFFTIDMRACEAYMRETGEVPDGCKVETVYEAGEVGGEVKRTTLRIDTEKVARALGPQLEPVAQLLLDGGLEVAG